ncbi:hypothetical protein [Actinomadura rubrisoli]|uniref:Uncharacterized protein n=1 Tax=Actinomadura rubrisoli TaxID=2530368 RepID=A0A4R5CII7_9ACTN|nr:hypothetical protein [Actinomadura rubrisoli]TDD97172.1 hypothetical protein E1298_01685 [Actinomadura rubrisoli]
MTSAKNNAAQNEVDESPVEVKYKGITYVVPPALDLPVELLETEGELDVIRLMIGDEKYAEFRATQPTLRDLKNLGELLSDAAGFGELGN